MTETAKPKFTSAHVLAVAAVAFVPMAILLSKGVAPIFALAAIGVAAVEIVRSRKLPLLSGAVVWPLAGLAGWSLLSWLWSISPDDTVKTGISFAITLFGGAVLMGAAARFDARERRIFEFGLIVGGALGFALIAFEFATDAWLAQHLYALRGKKLFLVYQRHTAAMNPGLAATALFFWSWALAVRGRFPGWVANAAIAAALALFMMSDSDAVVVALVAGTAVFGAMLVLPRAVPTVLAAAVAAGVILAPLVPGMLPDPLDPNARIPGLTMSGAHRIVIWKNTVRHIRNNPVGGGGFDTARTLYGGKDRVQYRFPESIAGVATTTEYEPIPLHPHNGVLQVWLELGLVGALLVAGLLLAVIRAVAGIAERRRRAVALATVTTTLTIASISFGAWQSWWLASILLAGAFLIVQVTPAADPAPARPEAATPPPAAEIGGPKGPEPTRYGDWERKGRAIDF